MKPIFERKRIAKITARIKLTKMKKTIFIISGFIILGTACNNKESAEALEIKKTISDSSSKAEQRRKGDSMKRENPLLIIPPDSTYTGDYVDKYGNGVIKFKGLFRFGQRHGLWMSFYPNGNMWSELYFDKGLKHGYNAAYYKNGKKRYEGVFKNNKQDSIWCYYDTSGVLAERVLYEKDSILKKLPKK